MILIDTNVISELMREKPDATVMRWIQSMSATEFWLTSITIAEIKRGILRLPESQRRQRLQTKFDEFVIRGFRRRIFSFDEAAAHVYGEICRHRENAGLAADPVDMMIAAIAKTNNAALATRNIKDFSDCGIVLINPWDI